MYICKCESFYRDCLYMNTYIYIYGQRDNQQYDIWLGLNLLETHETSWEIYLPISSHLEWLFPSGKQTKKNIKKTWNITIWLVVGPPL